MPLAASTGWDGGARWAGRHFLWPVLHADYQGEKLTEMDRVEEGFGWSFDLAEIGVRRVGECSATAAGTLWQSLSIDGKLRFPPHS
jgi:hypothetical protein